MAGFTQSSYSSPADLHIELSHLANLDHMYICFLKGTLTLLQPKHNVIIHFIFIFPRQGRVDTSLNIRAVDATKERVGWQDHIHKYIYVDTHFCTFLLVHA